jgi:hypothetical protein
MKRKAPGRTKGPTISDPEQGNREIGVYPSSSLLAMSFGNV